MTDTDKALRESHFHIQWCQLSEYILQVPLKTWPDQRANTKEKPKSTWSLIKPEFPDIVQPKISWCYFQVLILLRNLHFSCKISNMRITISMQSRKRLSATHVALFNSPLANSSNWKRILHLFASFCFFSIPLREQRHEPTRAKLPFTLYLMCVITGLCINTE